MPHALYLIAWNLLIVVPLAGAILAASKMRWFRERPALQHGLWMLVLLKLITPPIISLPLLPPRADLEEVSSEISSDEATRGEVPRVVGAGTTGHHDDAADEYVGRATSGPARHVEVRESPDTQQANESMSNAQAGGGPDESPPILLSHLAIGATLVVWLSVAVWLWIVAVRRAWHIRRLLATTSSEPGREMDALHEVCRHFRLKIEPRLLVVDEAISPMLWAELRRPTIVLPRALTNSIADDQLRHILAHELAHFVRQDHWANCLAFFIASLFWWNPIARLARRELRNAAEACCDAMAIERLAGSRKSYAETLLAAVDFAASSKPMQPSPTPNFGESHSLKRRIEMIANPNVNTSLSRSRWLLLVCGMALLTLLPARAQPDTPDNAKGSKLAAVEQPGDIESETDDNLGAQAADNVTNPLEVPGSGARSDQPQDVRGLTLLRPQRGKYFLPDYLPAAHGNAVKSLPEHHFMLQPYGNPRVWYVMYARDSGKGTGRILWDTKLTIPPKETLKQGDTFVLHTGRNVVFIAFVEDEYSNDRDIGVKIIDTKSGRIMYECTLLRDMSRYQWMADSMSAVDDVEPGQADGEGKDTRKESDAAEDLPATSNPKNGAGVTTPKMGLTPGFIDFTHPFAEADSSALRAFCFFIGVGR